MRFTEMAMNTLLHMMAFLVFPVGMAYAAASDLVSMTISNRVSLFLIATFAILVPMTGLPLSEIGMHLAAAAAVLAFAFFCFSRGWIGGGDAKIAAVAALWLGWDHTLEFIGLSAAFGGLLTLALLSFRGTLLPVSVSRVDWVARLHDRKSGVPYGIALAAGALAIYPETVWLHLAV